VFLQVSTELDGLGRMLVCYAATTKARLSRPGARARVRGDAGRRRAAGTVRG
jgi:hypothetical protein